jgi:hypothetical protein
MQHAHVKRKEYSMNRYVAEELYRIPDLHQRLDLAARRERARAIHAGFVWLKTQLSPRLDPARWLARLG